jgi:diguanylate cyclase (GGDEF)-like protein
LLPEYVAYRVTVRLTTVIVAMIILGFLLGITIPPFRLFFVEQLIMLRDVRSTVFWIFSAVALSILLLSVFSESHTLGIGGTHAGAVVLLALGWIPPDADVVLQGMVLAWMPVLIAIGTLSHWFQRLENRASYDPLLRIYNRGWCDQVLEEQSLLDTRPPFGIALIDLDHFKAVNDTHGHEAGDTVLREIAQRIRTAVVPRGTVARYGGEELILFFPQTDEDELRELLEAVRVDVEGHPVRHRKEEIPVTCSIGYAVRTVREQPPAEVLRGGGQSGVRGEGEGAQSGPPR